MVSMECFACITFVVRAMGRVIGIGCVDEDSVVDLPVDCIDDDIVVVDLPDDCLLEILSRLPSYDVLRCRRVCKRWRSLTSSAHFIEYQSNRAPTIVFGQVLGSKISDPTTIGYFRLDHKCHSKKLKKLQLNKRFTDYSLPLLYSFGGLLVFLNLSDRNYIVLNPTSGKSRVIPPPKNKHGRYYHGFLCGLFFHPLACEYRLLFVRISWADSKTCWYYIYESTTNTWRNINSSPLSFRPETKHDGPVVFNTSLHWIADCRRINKPERPFGPFPSTHGVMVFDIQSEEIFMFPLCGAPHPYQPLMMTLFVMDKQLWYACIILHRHNNSMMLIWELNNYVNRRWVLRHNISLNFFPKERCRTPYGKVYIMKAICVKKGMLLIGWNTYGWNESGLYLLDLATYALHRIDDHHFGSEPGRLYLFDTYKCSLLVPNV